MIKGITDKVEVEKLPCEESAVQWGEDSIEEIEGSDEVKETEDVPQ